MSSFRTSQVISSRLLMAFFASVTTSNLSRNRPIHHKHWALQIAFALTGVMARGRVEGTDRAALGRIEVDVMDELIEVVVPVIGVLCTHEEEAIS